MTFFWFCGLADPRASGAVRRLLKQLMSPLSEESRFITCMGLLWELTRGPLAPEARITPPDKVAPGGGASMHPYQTYQENKSTARAAIAQLGERQTEDLKVPGSIPGLGNLLELIS